MTLGGPLRADATDLVAWADRKDPESLLPTLVRRLVLASDIRIARASFAAGEGVQLGGWDGLVVAEGGNAFVPAGVSAWELGKNKDVKGKADRDYQKRRDDPDVVEAIKTTFVFVTPRRWGGKDAWASDRRKEGLFSDVRAYDADDLGTWLEQAPGVHLWFSRLVGKSPWDALDLEFFWEGWSGATIPETSPQLVVAGREEQEARLEAWLQEEAAGTFGLKGEAPEDSLAFLGATVERMAEDQRENVRSRCVLVSDPAAWRQLVESKGSLVLVPRFEAEGMVTGATSRGHRVFLPMGAEHAGVGEAVDLPRLGREAAAEALRGMGIENHVKAEQRAGLARRSLTAMRRELARSPEFRTPEWARPTGAKDVIPAFFAGAWEEGNEADRVAVAKLAGRSYEEVSSALMRWAEGPDVPARLSAGRWLLASKEDAWRLLNERFSAEEMRRFEEVAFEVLGRRDPSYDLPSGRRWAANVYGKTRPESGLLRQGLAETLAIMGVRGDKTLSDGTTGRDRAESIVGRLLGAAGTEWVAWASLSGVLPLLAEAAPRRFLRTVESDLTGEDPALARLFTDTPDSGSDHSPHTELLWSLETLARSREHLPRAALALARLARLDPGGGLANRPLGSLVEVFSVRAPWTDADLAERMRVMDTVRERETEVGWALLLAVLPGLGGVVLTGSRPRYQEWAGSPTVQFSGPEFETATDDVAKRLVEDVGTDGRRWAQLLGVLRQLPQPRRVSAMEKLATLPGATLEHTRTLRDALRGEIEKHRTHSDTWWALSESEVDTLEASLELLQPEDLAANHAWLFCWHPDLPKPPGTSREQWHREVAEKRLEAVREVLEAGGIEQVFELAKQAEVPGFVGKTVGESELTVDEDALLSRVLDPSSEGFEDGFCAGYLNGRFSKGGWEWAKRKLAEAGEHWAAEQKAKFLAFLPLDDRAREVLTGLDTRTRELFWGQAGTLRLDHDSDLVAVAEGFLEHDRPYAAADALHLGDGEDNAPPAELVVRVLEAAAASGPPEDMESWHVRYVIAELLGLLYKAWNLDEDRLATLEWAFYGALKSTGKTPTFLYRKLSREPQFLAGLAQLIFKPDTGESPEPTGEQAQRAEQAFDLLEVWHDLPGYSEDGTLSTAELQDWISEAQSALRQVDRAERSESLFGRLLVKSPLGSDGGWPHEAVRDTIEWLSSDSTEEHLFVEIINGRGVYTKGRLEGGEQERSLAQRYEGYADMISPHWTRTANVLYKVAEYYNRWARSSDSEAQFRQDL